MVGGDQFEKACAASVLFSLHVYADTAHMDCLPPAHLCENPNFVPLVSIYTYFWYAVLWNNMMICTCTEIGLVWYGQVGLVNCMVKCVNTKMGRTPTGSGCLRLVIMHNLKNEEERKGNLLQRSRKIAFSSMSEFSDWFCQPDQQLLDYQQQINAFH